MLITKTFKQWLTRDTWLPNTLTTGNGMRNRSDRIVAVPPLEGQGAHLTGADACACTCCILWEPKARIEVTVTPEPSSAYQINGPILLEVQDAKSVAPRCGRWELSGALGLQASFRGVRVGGLGSHWSGSLDFERGKLELVMPALAPLGLGQEACFALATDGRDLGALDALLRTGPESH